MTDNMFEFSLIQTKTCNMSFCYYVFLCSSFIILKLTLRMTNRINLKSQYGIKTLSALKMTLYSKINYKSHYGNAKTQTGYKNL